MKVRQLLPSMPRDLLNKLHRVRGVMLVEVIIAISILSTAVVMMLLTITLFLDTRGELVKKTKALYLAEEGLEVLRYIRDEDWDVLESDLGTDVLYYLDVSAGGVATSSNPEIIDGSYRREFILREVYRDDTTDDIIASTTSPSKYVDPETVEVVMRVGYGTGTTTMRTLLTNIFDI